MGGGYCCVITVLGYFVVILVIVCGGHLFCILDGGVVGLGVCGRDWWVRVGLLLCYRGYNHVVLFCCYCCYCVAGVTCLVFWRGFGRPRGLFYEAVGGG